MSFPRTRESITLIYETSSDMQELDSRVRGNDMIMYHKNSN